ncbi:hypothetical protein BDFG_03420 [Blastomyces dermatitidis ATCC 26199]|nr:hypothetical protein BDFG_03420 [Blastomyces dermatitidis ATCC 26199]
MSAERSKDGSHSQASREQASRELQARPRINGTGIDLMVWIQLTGAVSKMHPLLASKIFHSSVPHQL